MKCCVAFNNAPMAWSTLSTCRTRPGLPCCAAPCQPFSLTASQPFDAQTVSLGVSASTATSASTLVLKLSAPSSVVTLTFNGTAVLTAAPSSSAKLSFDVFVANAVSPYTAVIPDAASLEPMTLTTGLPAPLSLSVTSVLPAGTFLVKLRANNLNAPSITVTLSGSMAAVALRVA